jgi:hypothetical protein
MDQKKNRNWTERNRMQLDHRLQLLTFEAGSVAGCLTFKNMLKPLENRL